MLDLKNAFIKSIKFGDLSYDNDEIMIITVGGQMVRTSVKGIRKTGRIAQGVQIVKLHGSDRLQDIAPVITAERAEESVEDNTE